MPIYRQEPIEESKENQVNAGLSITSDLESVTFIIKELAASPEEMNHQEILNCLEKIKKQITGIEGAELPGQINDYEYDDALESLEKIAKDIGVDL